MRTTSFDYPFSGFLPNFEDDSHKFNQLYNLRIFFPLSAAPRLGFVLGFLLLAIPIKNFYALNTRKTRDRIIASLLLFGIILTVSRGPIISLILSLLIYHFLRVKDNFKTGFKNSIYIIVSLIFLVVIFNQYLSLEDFKFDRLFSLGTEDASFQGHANVRLLSVTTIFSSSVLNLFFGYGIGHTQDVLDVSSAHSSFFTILLEQGLLGFFAFISLFLIMTFNSIKLYINSRRKSLNSTFYKYLVAISVFLTVIHLVYDATTLVIVWAYNGLILGLIKYETNRIKYYYTRI
jgi:O-antigen ligase